MKNVDALQVVRFAIARSGEAALHSGGALGLPSIQYTAQSGWLRRCLEHCRLKC
jgi:hypothetical protein